MFTPQNATVRNKVEEGARKREKWKRHKGRKREEGGEKSEKREAGGGGGKVEKEERREKERESRVSGMVIQFLGVTFARGPRHRNFVNVTPVGTS